MSDRDGWLVKGCLVNNQRRTAHNPFHRAFLSLGFTGFDSILVFLIAQYALFSNEIYEIGVEFFLKKIRWRLDSKILT